MVTADKQSLKNYNKIWMQFDKDNQDKHQLFFKEHFIKNQEPEYPKGQTLFVLNIPPYATIDALQHAFTKLCGNVLSVTITNLKGCKSVYIVFEKEASIEKALSLSEDTVIILNKDIHLCVTGLTKWCKEYNSNLSNEKTIQDKIEDYMKKYDQKIMGHLSTADDENPDEGWVTVTGRKKRGQFAPSRKESTIKKVQHKQEEKRKKQLINFYSFQIRETKKQNLAELRKKFELDKKRLQELKSKRSFKPF